MRLPNAEQARIDRAKVVDYLLSLEHEGGGDKAQFFLRFGFSPGRWEELAEALRAHGASHEIAGARETPHGVNYRVEGVMHTPDGRNPRVRTVWAVERGSSIPRLVSAYPRRRGYVQGT